MTEPLCRRLLGALAPRVSLSLRSQWVRPQPYRRFSIQAALLPSRRTYSTETVTAKPVTAVETEEAAVVDAAATEANLSEEKPEHMRLVHRLAKKTPFAVYNRLPSVRQTYKNPVPAFHERQIARLDPTGSRTALFSKARLDSAKVGDVLMVTTKQGEPFSGVLIQIRRRGVDTAIQLRGQLMKTGVEMWYKIYSPTISAINIIWRRPKRARRARLTFMRKPKHDMGSVDHLVFSWKREQSVLRSSSKKTQKR